MKAKLIFQIFILFFATSLLSAATINYTILKQEDISALGIKRSTYRILLDVNKIPSEAEINNLVKEFWSLEKKQWDEVTVFIYLPEMKTNEIAYAVAELTSKNEIQLKIQPSSLYGTKWEPYKDQLTIQPPSPNKANSYYINILPKVIDNSTIQITVETNFPDKTAMSLSVYRPYYQQGKSDAFVGEIFDEEFIIQGGKYQQIIKVSDLYWHSKYQQLVKDLPDLFNPIENITPTLTISVTYTPLAEQPEEVTSILGEKGEYIRGNGAKNHGKMTTFSASSEVNLKLNLNDIESEHQQTSLTNLKEIVGSKTNFYLIISGIIGLLIFLFYKNKKT